MSYYVDKIQDKLAENSDIAIKQLENDDLIGNLEATYLLGKLYYDGIYRRPDAVKAVELWEKGAGNNDIDCLRALGDCYFFGFGYEENNEKAMEIYQEVLKKNPNDYRALCQIGRMHGHGWGVPQDVSYAVALLKNAWEKGSGRAATEIGLLYMFDMEETVENRKEAIKWYQRGAESGDPKGCYRMGLLYYWGEYGLPTSPKMAYQFLLRATELSDALTFLIETGGCGVAAPADMERLFVEAERRADFGDKDLQGALGQAYARGIGVEANRELATKWYLRAIESGNTFAEYEYGTIFALGLFDFEKNAEKAYKYLSHAAQEGQTYAMKPLAELLDDEDTYIPGLSYEEHNAQMMHWFEMAVENGDAWAAVTLGEKFEKGHAPVLADVASAIHYYQIAADHDIDTVYLPLAKLYMMPGITANYELAQHYLSLARKRMEENGTLSFYLPEIEFYYGKMCKEGLGIPQNLEEAHRHFVNSAEKGYPDAVEELKHMKKGLLGWKII